MNENVVDTGQFNRNANVAVNCHFRRETSFFCKMKENKQQTVICRVVPKYASNRNAFTPSVFVRSRLGLTLIVIEPPSVAALRSRNSCNRCRTCGLVLKSFAKIR